LQSKAKYPTDCAELGGSTMSQSASNNGAAAPTDLQQTLARVSRHFQAGRHRAALELIEEARFDEGDVPELLHMEGMCRHAAGDAQEGLDLIQQAIDLAPEHAGFVADMGALIAQSGKIDEALPYFEQSTELAPKYAGGWTNLGAAHFMKKDYGAAIPALRKAVELEPSLLDAQRNLGIALQNVNRYHAAVEVFYRALAIDANDVGSHINLSAALFREERHDTAVHHARKALELAPDALEAHLHLGNALASMGKMEEAETHLLKAASRMPTGIGALSRLIHLRKTTEDSPEFKMLKRLEDKIDRLGPAARSNMHMAAGKAYADLKDYKASYEHFLAGNALIAEEHSFDLENHIGQVDRMIEMCTPALVSKMVGAAGLDDIAPIFVCGMPRSGTTLMEQMLSRHSLVQPGGEMNSSRVAFGQSKNLVSIMEERAEGEITSDDINQLAEAYIESVRRNGIAGDVITDKLPINYMYIGLLALALPRARFVIMRRHPMACCLSNWMQNFGRNQPFTTDFHNLGSVYQQYHRITDYWADLLPDQTKIVQYETVVSDVRPKMESVLDFCGLDWQDAVLDHAGGSRPVNTASVSQVRQPLYTDALARWMRYGPLLKDMGAPLADLLSEKDRKLLELT